MFRCLAGFLFLVLPLALPAQDSVLVENPTATIELAKPPAEPPLPPLETDPAAARPIPADEWQRAAEGLDYSRDQPEAEKQKPENQSVKPPSWLNWDWSPVGKGLQVLFILLAVLGIGWGIYLFWQLPKDRALAGPQAEISPENLEDNLPAADLDQHLQAALATGNFPLAVRLHFLKMLRRLSDDGDIRWSREKTNRDYLAELRGHPRQGDFQRAARAFERVWYGKISLDARQYAALLPELEFQLA